MLVAGLGAAASSPDGSAQDVGTGVSVEDGIAERIEDQVELVLSDFG